MIDFNINRYKSQRISNNILNKHIDHCVTDAIKKNNLTEKLHDVSKTQEFVNSDLKILFTRPYNRSSRFDYYKEIEPNFPNLSFLEEYQKGLGAIVPGSPSTNLSLAADYFHSDMGQEKLREIFNKTRFYDLTNIKNHSDYEKSIELMSNHLKNYL